MPGRFTRLGPGSYNLALDTALPGPVVKVQQDDLLPGPQKEAPPGQGDAQGGLQKGGAHVGVAVAVAPAAVMFIGNLPGEEAVDGLPQIIDRAGLKLDSGQGRGGTGDEQSEQPLCHPGLLKFGRHRGREVQDVGAARGRDLKGKGL